MWGRGEAKKNQSRAEIRKPKPKPNPSLADGKFVEAQQRFQAAIKKHGIEYISSSEEDELESNNILESVLSSYSQIGGTASDLGRTQRFLEDAFQSNAATCLICIGSVKRSDAIWSCEGCYCFFHLNCIQRWSKDSLFQQKSALEDIPQWTRSKKIINWGCPKCRKEYTADEVPRRYSCFCGVVVDPPVHPWLVPHSCGETCNQPLQPECGHKCLLLCHPGPCPPCPKTISVSCLCAQSPKKPVRCSAKYWECTSKCSKLLSCGEHKCSHICHKPPCPPCQEESTQSCRCGVKKELRRCSEELWQCDKICEKLLSCQLHKCEIQCHAGNCGQCPRSLPRKCPCGKQDFVAPCSEDVSPCGDTCGKPLTCGVHYCQQRCHRFDCSNCLAVVVKTCRCGNHSKELPCHKEYLCESKCKQMKDCGKHSCNRKCCDGNCPPCDKPCGRTLKCGRHKCPSQCHQGPCYPCVSISIILCRCSKTKIQVPCGREKKTKPPKCNNPCKLPTTCHHKTRIPHRCHQGDCPDCKQLCGKEMPCKHVCNDTCHDAVPVVLENNPRPVGPWEVRQSIVIKELPCPPCNYPVTFKCLGGHESPMWPCHETKGSRSCGRKCGRALSCGNHSCENECHEVIGVTSDIAAGDNCKSCELPCQRIRQPGCTHACVKPCHPGKCAACSVLVKQTCHCGITQLYLECKELFGELATEEIINKKRSCGNQCTKLYPCGHRCRDDCHPGDCMNANLCHKRVKYFCPCRRIKKDIPCDKIRLGEVELECDETCIEKRQREEKILQEQEVQRKLNEEERNKKEVEQFQKKFSKKRYKEKNRNEIKELPENKWKNIFIIVSIFIGVAAGIYYGIISSK